MVTLCALTAAELRLPTCLGDGAVLQREQPVTIWGWADAGATVTVSFAGENATTTATAAGTWQVTLGALSASAEGRELVVTAGDSTLTRSDVLVGDVWLCSGQSNMAFTMKMLATGLKGDGSYQPLGDEITADINGSNDPLLRMMLSPNATSPHAERDEFVDPSAISWVGATSPEHTEQFSGTGFYFGRALRRELEVPIGLLSGAHGGTPVEAWMPLAAVRSLDDLSSAYDSELAHATQVDANWDQAAVDAEHKEAAQQWRENGKKGRFPRKKQNPLHSSHRICTLYNARIAPLAPMAIRGVIWYQGESNANKTDSTLFYRQRFSTMIESWRTTFDQPALPFYFVQLAGFNSIETKPDGENRWSIIRDHQRQTLALPHTGMAVSLDIGQKEDIHPRNKREVGERLARWALHQHYGHADVIPSGPLYRGHSVSNGAMTITFDYCADGLRSGSYGISGPVTFTDAAPGAFEVRGADGTWHQADVAISAADTITVSHPDVASPTQVRYGWTMYAPKANLYNSAGLPASPFITE
jgi:sialate O-acetylesterase